MICFRDRVFCISQDCRCGSKLTNEVIAAAKRWWGNKNPPIAMARLCDDHYDELCAKERQCNTK